MDWMDEARQIAAQCWCDKETNLKVMDPILAEAFAKRLSFWMETAAHNQKNTDYYRGLLVQCGKAIGKEAYTQDDGGISDDVLCAKIPEIVEALVNRPLKVLLDWVRSRPAAALWMIRGKHKVQRTGLNRS